FFFSSRRRHTRSKRDWSSDVCSSDLKGLSGTYAGHTYQIGKPSIFTVVPDKIKGHTDELSADGKTVVYIAKDDAVIGYIAMMDTPNQAAKAAIDYLHQADVHTVMITGDNQVTGQAVANQVG